MQKNVKILELFNGICIVKENNIQKIIHFSNLCFSAKASSMQALITYTICRILKLNEAKFLPVITSFKGIKHRLQLISKIKPTSFINDSKSTNVYSSENAISYFNNIYWIAGGINKDQDFTKLLHLSKNIKKAYFFGKAAQEMFDIFKNKIFCMHFDNLQDAFKIAHENALSDVKENIVLFSHTCKSFDQFNNFEVRGYAFIKLCEQIKIHKVPCDAK